MGRENNDDLINSLKAMMNNTESASAGPASKKGRDDGDDFDREINSQLSDTLSRAMKNIKAEPVLQTEDDDLADKDRARGFVQSAIEIDDDAIDESENESVSFDADEEAFAVEETTEEFEPIVIEEIEEPEKDSDADKAVAKSLLDIFDIEPSSVNDDEEDVLFCDDLETETAEEKREKSQRSAKLIESLMSEISLREDENDTVTPTSTEEDEDAAFIASLKQVSRAASVSSRNKSDNVQRRGFVTNDADIENSIYLPGAETPDKGTAKKVKEKSKTVAKKKARRENEKKLRDKDISLAISLGYEYELAERIGYDEVKDHKRKTSAIHSFAVGDKTSEETGTEYTDVSQSEDIKSEYLRLCKSFKAKTVLTAIAFLLLLAVENLKLFAGDGLDGTFIGSHPVIIYLVSFLLTVGVALLSFKQLSAGFTDALKFNSSAFSVSSFTVFSVLIYDAVALVMVITKGESYMLLNSPAVLGLLIALVSRCLDCKREYGTFCIVSNPTEKYLAEEYEPIVKDREMRYYSKNRNKNCEGFLKTDVVGSVDGYFEQTSRPSAWYKNQNFLVAPIIATVLIIFILSYIKSTDLLKAYSYMIAALSVCMPVSMCLYNSVCLFRASKDMKKKDCAMIGESAADRYSEACGIIFKESSMVEASLTGIDRERTCSDEELSRVSPYINKIIKLLDSSVTEALKGTFEEGDGEDLSVRIERVEDDGIIASTDAGNTVYIGEREFMIRHRINIRTANISLNNEEIYKKNVGVLYVAVDDLMCWKIFLEYSVKEEFAEIVALLTEEGIDVGLETSNPNINDDFLLKHHIPTSVNFFDSDRFAINCTADGDGEEERPKGKGLRSGYGGIVALKETYIVYPIVWCKRICENLRFGIWVTAISVSVAAVIMGVFAVIGNHEMMNSALLTLMSALLSFPSMLAGAFFKPVRTVTETGQDTLSGTDDKKKEK